MVEPHFGVLAGIIYTTDHPLALETPLEQDPDLLNQCKMQIVERDDVAVWIEMTQGKARLVVTYEQRIQ